MKSQLPIKLGQKAQGVSVQTDVWCQPPIWEVPHLRSPPSEKSSIWEVPHLRMSVARQCANSLRSSIYVRTFQYQHQQSSDSEQCCECGWMKVREMSKKLRLFVLFQEKTFLQHLFLVVENLSILSCYAGSLLPRLKVPLPKLSCLVSKFLPLIQTNSQQSPMWWCFKIPAV